MPTNTNINTAKNRKLLATLRLNIFITVVKEKVRVGKDRGENDTLNRENETTLKLCKIIG